MTGNNDYNDRTNHYNDCASSPPSGVCFDNDMAVMACLSVTCLKVACLLNDMSQHISAALTNN